LGALNSFKVLDALIREINERKKKGLEDPRAQYTVLLNRVINENNSLNESSARPQISRYLKRLMKDGFVVKEKIGRKVFYDVTAKGRFEHLSNRDRLDHSREWYEEAYNDCYYSFSITPSKYGLIHERRTRNELKGKDELMDAIQKLRKVNPGLESVYIRLEDEEV
jgi:DNA-binding PadR family transcriptional regulator